MLTEIRIAPRRGELTMVGVGIDEEVLLKARLPLYPAHPRALISVLEGFALWSGRKLPAACAVGDSSRFSIEALLPDGLAWTSPLVDLHLVDRPARRRARLQGVAGDFRAAIQLRLPVIP